MKRMKRLLMLAIALCMILSTAVTPVMAAQKEPYVVSSNVTLALGRNKLTLDTSAVTTIYEFEPSQSGVYRFTADNSNAKVGFWGNGRFFVSDQTQNKTSTLEYTLPNVGPSIMIGISGVASCTLTVSRVGDANVAVEPEWVQYKNTVKPKAFTMPEDSLVAVDVTDKTINTAVLGKDGYYHLDSTNGPVLYANLSHSTASLVTAMSYGQVRRYYFNADGSIKMKLDFTNALNEYLDCADKNMYPVTEDIKKMFVDLGEAKGWYDQNIMGNYLFTGLKVDPAEAWMFACSYHDCHIAQYRDVNAGRWYHQALDYMVGNRYMNGTSGTTMEPDAPLNRAMLVHILYKMAGSPSVNGKTMPFRDVAEDKWYYNAIVWAYNENVVEGTGPNTFKPTANITRQDLAVILYRAKGAPKVNGDLNGFTDANNVKDYARDAMIWCVKNGLINGIASGSSITLEPRGNATRAQAAAMLMRYHENNKA